MKLKSLIVSVTVLVAISAVVFIARRPKTAAGVDARVGGPLLDAGAIEQAAKLHITDQGKAVHLTRQPDGSWRVDNYHDLRADFSKLSQFVTSLSDAKVTRFISARPEITSRLEFKDTRIELADAGDKTLAALALGKTAESRGRYVRLGEEPRTYLTSLNAWIDADPKNWADTQLLSLKPDDIAQVEISLTGESSVSFTRPKANEPWTSAAAPKDQKIADAKLSSLINSLTNLRFSDTSDLQDQKAAGARKHAQTFKLTTFDGKAYTVALGRKPEEKKLKVPAPGATDFTKNSPVKADGSVKPIEPEKPELPEFETVPAGPAYVFISSSDESAPINAWMRKRTFQVPDYVLTGLPQKISELFESPSIPPASPDLEKKPAANP